MANHPSIEAIKENTPEQGYSSFNFKPVDQSFVSKSIKKLNPQKATGVDQLPAKLIKAGSTALAGPISTVFNVQCAKVNQFYFAFAYISFFFIPVCFLPALLCFA